MPDQRTLKIWTNWQRKVYVPDDFTSLDPATRKLQSPCLNKISSPSLQHTTDCTGIVMYLAGSTSMIIYILIIKHSTKILLNIVASNRKQSTSTGPVLPAKIPPCIIPLNISYSTLKPTSQHSNLSQLSYSLTSSPGCRDKVLHVD